MDERSDFGGTTAVVTWVRKRITPTAVWSTGVTLAVAVAYVVNAQHDISSLKDAVAESRTAVTQLKSQLEVLHKIDTQLAVMSTQLDTIAAEVDRQREWRERIEDLAESPPHARRRH